MAARFQPADELARLTADIVRPAYLTVGCLYLALGGAQPWIGPPNEPLWLVSLLWLTGVAVLTAWLGLVRWPPNASNANPLLLALVAVVALNAHLFLDWARDPIHSTNHILTFLAAGFAFASRPWFVAGLSAVLLSWLPIALADGMTSLAWRHWTSMVGAGAVLAVLVFETRRWALLQQLELRRLAEDREREAARALEEANLANAQRLEMQAAMEEAQRRESLGMLAGGIAHDFNNLLSVLSGNLELIRDAAGEDIAGHLDDAEAAARQATRLTNQMLSYAGRARPQVKRIALGQRIGEIAGLLESSLPSHTSIHRLGKEFGPQVFADGSQIDQVVMNLLQNAADALAERGGSIELDWGVQHLDEKELSAMRLADAAESGEFAFVEVSDDGPGMHQDIADRMFSPFFTTKAEGTGLGLSTVEGIVKAHRGALAVTSDEGLGTRIRVALPLRPAPEVETSASTPEPKRWGGTVLVVDDQPEVRRIARHFLERDGFDVQEASNPAEALALNVNPGDFRFALLDLTMPGGTGYDLAHALQKKVPHLPIAVMSGFDRDDVLSRHGEAPVLPFLAKPFSGAQLRELVATLLED